MKLSVTTAATPTPGADIAASGDAGLLASFLSAAATEKLPTGKQ